MIPHVDRWGNRGTEHSMTPHQRHMCEVAKQHLDVGSAAPTSPATHGAWTSRAQPR